MDPSCVIKIGGSLLDLPDLPGRLEALLDDFSRPFPIAVCGGGDAVDLVRKWDRIHHLGEETSHWIALSMLGPTAFLLESVCDRFQRVDHAARFPAAWERRKVPLLDAAAFVRGVDAAREDPMPRRWSVTSDSIAARMAECFRAPELVLLKSAAVEPGTTIAEAARAGAVDPYFPLAARAIPRIVWVNLREENSPETPLIP